MGNLVKIPHSELNATLERLDCQGVDPEHFRRVRSDDAFCSDLAAFLRGERELASLPEWVTPLLETDIPAHLAETHAKWVKFAKEVFSYEGPLAFRVKAGFNFRKHGPSYGPCLGRWAYAKGWELKNCESTADSIVFWVPCFVPDSANKNEHEQKALLASLRETYELPAHHLQGLGSVSLNAALILSYHKRSGERVLKKLYARTETLISISGSLHLGNFTEDGLDCDWWGDDAGHRLCSLVCMALGVEKL